jgi:adenylate kinase
MKVYIQPLEQIQEFYTKKDLLKKINGERTIEKIVTEMDEYIQSKI